MGKLKARMIDWAELAPEVRQINFEVLGDEPFVFTPGQFVSVIEKHQGREVIRPYSIASPRDGRRFSLCLNRVSEGIVSPYLFALEPNDEVEIGQPLGYFTLRHPDHRAVMIATGTGIAPFRSMLASASHVASSKGSANGSSSGPEHLATTVTLLFGARVEENLLYRDEMEHLAQTHPRFRFIPTLTRPSASWSGRIGRVQAHLDEALTPSSADADRETDVYICGMKEMVDDLRTQLKQRGFDRKHIIYEKYD